MRAAGAPCGSDGTAAAPPRHRQPLQRWSNHRRRAGRFPQPLQSQSCHPPVLPPAPRLQHSIRRRSTVRPAALQSGGLRRKRRRRGETCRSGGGSLSAGPRRHPLEGHASVRSQHQPVLHAPHARPAGSLRCHLWLRGGSAPQLRQTHPLHTGAGRPPLQTRPPTPQHPPLSRPPPRYPHPSAAAVSCRSRPPERRRSASL